MAQQAVVQEPAHTGVVHCEGLQSCLHAAEGGGDTNEGEVREEMGKRERGEEREEEGG